VQDAFAHVDGIDLCRAALQQTICEAARRGADVRADQAGHVQAEGCEGGIQLFAAARNEARTRIHCQNRISWDGGGGERDLILRALVPP
jgi:hypothetical protein